MILNENEIIISGDKHTQTAKDNSAQAAGDKAIQIAGDWSAQAAGDGSVQKAGDESIQITGNKSFQCAGVNTLQISRWHDDVKRRVSSRIITDKEEKKWYYVKNGIWVEKDPPKE